MNGASSTLIERVFDFVEAERRPIDAGSVATGTKIDIDVVRTFLSMLHAKGRLLRTERGVYRIVPSGKVETIPPEPARVDPSTAHEADPTSRNTSDPVDPHSAQQPPERALDGDLTRLRADVVRLSCELLAHEEELERLAHEAAQVKESHRWTLSAHRAATIDLRNAEQLAAGKP